MSNVKNKLLSDELFGKWPNLHTKCDADELETEVSKLIADAYLRGQQDFRERASFGLSAAISDPSCDTETAERAFKFVDSLPILPLEKEKP